LSGGKKSDRHAAGLRIIRQDRKQNGEIHPKGFWTVLTGSRVFVFLRGAESNHPACLFEMTELLPPVHHSFTARMISLSGFTPFFVMALLGMAANGATPIPLKPGRHLFLDDSLLDRDQCSHIERQMTPPTRIRRVMKPDRPWEELGFIFYSTVLDVDGTAMLYYGCYDGEKGKHLGLATSRDGISWERPELHLTSFQGSMANNLFPFEAVEAGVFLDPTAPPDKRFRLLHNRYWPDPEKAGVYLSSSADGIHWMEHPTRLFPRVPDSQPSGFRDSRIGKYVVYLRAWDPFRAVARVEMDDIESPWPFDRSAAPRYAWGKDKVATIGTELPIVMRPDERDPGNVHLYTSAVFQYPWAHDAYLAFPAAYFHYTGESLRERALDSNDGTFDVQLAVSRDGIHWERNREPWVEPDYIDGVSLQLVSMATGMIRRGREIHQYFVGWPHTHNRPVKWDRDLEDREASKKRDLGGIYCATTRLDGFVAIAAGSEEGVMTTRELSLEGNRLNLNIDTSGTGYATVALLDEDGIPFPGFAHSDCDMIHADEVDFRVKWKGGGALDFLKTKKVRVQIRMRNTRIWAFGVGQE
jgi:predicted GH43/DUF377 family glycosyl hydrolase